MSVIVERITNFLKEFPPFNLLSPQEIEKVVLSIRVINIEKNKNLFKTNDPLHDCFYIVGSGSINLTIIADAEETLINKCIEGDVFGLRPFFAKNNYMMTATAREESIIYAIPILTFKPLVASNESVLNFLLEIFGNNSANPNELDQNGKLLYDNNNFSKKSSEIQYFQNLSYNKAPFIAGPSASVKEVALGMCQHSIDYVIVTKHNTPIGIVTDTDMRIKVATGRVEITASIDRVMSSPVITVTESISLAEAQLFILNNNISHLVVTQDGTDKSAIKGIITQNDLIVAQASNPGILIKEIKRSLDAPTLKKIQMKLTQIIQNSITKNIPISHITNITGEINLAIIKRAVELAIIEMGTPPARFAWLSIGSQGRKEQMLLTDHDNILVFEDVAEEKYATIKEYFIKLSIKVTVILENIGYKTCENNNVASNSKWCKSLKEWLKQYDGWINRPINNTEDHCGIFFDYEIAYGETSLEKAITDFIFTNTNKNKLFFDYLGNDALRKPPPLTFFKNFNTEESAEHKDKFDIKNRAILPLVDSARLLTMSHGIRGINNTYLRFKQLAIFDPKHAEIYLNCAEAFQFLSRIRTIEGLKNENTGQYIRIEELSKVDKERLKNEFSPMRDLEELIKDTFQLTQFS